MYKDKFVMSILHKGDPLGEFGPSYDKKVSMPFDSEYAIRLRNKNDKACTASVFINGVKLNSFGDFVILQNSFITLEKFINESMHSSEELKFVLLDRSNISNSCSKSNYIVKVEFKLLKNNGFVTVDSKTCPKILYWQPNVLLIPKKFSRWSKTDYMLYKKPTIYNNNVSNFYSVDNDTVVKWGNILVSFFSYNHLDVEESLPVVLKLTIVGTKSKVVTNKRKLFCTKCGTTVYKNDRFCGQCGCRL